MNRYEAKFNPATNGWGVFNNKTNTFFEAGDRWSENYAEQYADDLNDHLATKYRDPEFDLERLA